MIRDYFDPMYTHNALPMTFSLSDPLSIAANQTRCPFTTKDLSTSDDAVYKASFGSHPAPMRLSKKRFIKVSPLGLAKPILLPEDFSLKLQECNLVHFNIAAISQFARNLTTSLPEHPHLSAGARQW